MVRMQFVPLLMVAPLLALSSCTQGGSSEKQPMAGMEMHGNMPMPTTNGSLKIVSPAEGQKITGNDIPVRVAVSNFNVSSAHVGMPDTQDEGHIHVMLDGMNMGVLYNFYTTPEFTLPGRAMTPGPHTLIFDLATNTHMDIPSTVQKVNIDYAPAQPEPAPAPVANAGEPSVKILSPADGATVGPQFTMKVQPANFEPALDLEGKPNIQGYGHYHVFVDMDMSSMESMEMPSQQSGQSMEMSGNMNEMMSMAGMVGMPGNDTFPVDLSAWKSGKHTIMVEPVQNDHTNIAGAKPAMITINLQGAAQ